ncbi:MAG: hypothetical protein AUK58_01590 [Candidatus Moranbacteria bacterium CG2_30_41_165]|nr:MAG: hypothetical protein AUK58_01590 [Candidatus Moranbacteria bacterium CG2_30_41_165]
MTKKQSILALGIFFIGTVLLVLLFSYIVSKSDVRISFPKWNIFFPASKKISLEETGTVKRVVDGDTIEMENGEKVRYIGINTPESVDPRRAIECFGKEASAYNKNLVEGKEVRLVKDVSDRDKYGRLLRFVYLENGTFVNELLVREGYAFVASYPPDISKQDIFRTAEIVAKKEGRGLWSETTCNGKKE